MRVAKVASKESNFSQMHVEKADNLSNLSGSALPEHQQHDAVKVYGEVREHIMRKPAPLQLMDMAKKSIEGQA